MSPTHLLSPSHIDGTVSAIGGGYVGACFLCPDTTGDTASFRGARPIERDVALDLLRLHLRVVHKIARCNIRVLEP